MKTSRGDRRVQIGVKAIETERESVSLGKEVLALSCTAMGLRPTQSSIDLKFLGSVTATGFFRTLFGLVGEPLNTKLLASTNATSSNRRTIARLET